MKGQLSGLWIVGKIKWKSPGIADIRVARNKTEARLNAELQLAHARVYYDKNTTNGYTWSWNHDKDHKFYLKKKYGTFDRYTEAVMSKRASSSDSYLLRLYLMLRDGIWLYGPDGESIHIKQARPAQIKARQQAEAKWDKQTDTLAKSLIASIK